MTMTATQIAFAVRTAIDQLDGQPLEIRCAGPLRHTRRHLAFWRRTITIRITRPGTYTTTELFEVAGPLIFRVPMLTHRPAGIWCKPGDTVTLTPDFRIDLPNLPMSDASMARYLTRPPKELR